MSLLKRVSGKTKREETTKTQPPLTESFGPSNGLVADININSDSLNFNFHPSISAVCQENVWVVIANVYFLNFLDLVSFFLSLIA